jgi:hypothetical protein
MNIELSEEQFRRLLKLVYLGNYVVNGLRAGDREDPRIAKYDEIEELFLKLAGENGCKELVHFDIRTQKYFPAESFELDDEIEGYIDEYNEDAFWDELGERLAERDIMEEMGEEILSRLDDTERIRIVSEAQEKYFGEFEESGIDNLRLVPYPVPGDAPIM